MKTRNCGNLNHRRSNPPVRACPQCGEVVNPAIAAKKCSEQTHAIKRKQSMYCVDCGEMIIGPRPV